MRESCGEQTRMEVHNSQPAGSRWHKMMMMKSSKDFGHMFLRQNDKVSENFKSKCQILTKLFLQKCLFENLESALWNILNKH